MDPREEAKRLFQEEHLSLAEIAEKLSVKYDTLKSWKRRDSWCSEEASPVRCKSPRAIKRVQNKSKPSTRPPFEPKNQMATIHGLFARYLPDETLDIVQQINDRGPRDVLFDQIQLAYAALLRAQKIMDVADHYDMTKEVQSESSSSQGSSESYQVQQAWDKQATFMAAQARAQTTLTNMIKQYEEMSHYELAAEKQRARIDQIKATTNSLTGGSGAAVKRVVINRDF